MFNHSKLFFDLLNLMNYCKVRQKGSDLQDYKDESPSAAIGKQKKHQNGLTKEKNVSTLQF